ncbi:MAG: adenylyl-sulfate kinase [Bacteroidota bacterium]
MLFIQLTGLSGSGKSTIAIGVKRLLESKGLYIEVVDGDIYRKQLCSDLGFSKEDRLENIRRLGSVCNEFARNGIIAILAAINPFEAMRKKLSLYGPHVKKVWIDCDLKLLIDRDTKQLYRKAMLPDNHPDKIHNLTGVNDPYEIPLNPDLIINTGTDNKERSIIILADFILQECNLNS